MEGLGLDPSLVEKMLQPARELDQGDLSLPCFPFANAWDGTCADIAEAIRAAMPEHEAIGEVGAVNGYLNILAESTVWLADQLLGSVSLGRRAPATWEVLIEHTSANPNGPFHVGRARNAILGDSVGATRLWGDDVTAEYYVDDMGKQVAVLAWALEHLSGDEEVEAVLSDREPVNPQWSQKVDHERVRWYQAAQRRRQDDANAADIEEAIGSKFVHASEHGDHIRFGCL